MFWTSSGQESKNFLLTRWQRFCDSAKANMEPRDLCYLLTILGNFITYRGKGTSTNPEQTKNWSPCSSFITPLRYKDWKQPLTVYLANIGGRGKWWRMPGKNPLSFPPEPESRVGVGGTSGRWKPPPTRSHGPESAALPEIKLAKISTSWDDIC